MADHPNSFDARDTLEGRRPRARDLPARRAAVEVRRRAAAVLAEGPAREPAAHRGQRRRRGRRHRGARHLGRARPSPSTEIAFTPARVVMQDFTGVPARRRPRRDARRDGRPRRRPGEDQPARPGRARHRPLGAGRRVRHARRLRASTPSASSSATRSATRSCAGARTRSTTSRSSRRTPASSTRSTSSTSRASSSSTTRPAAAYPDTLVGTDSHTTMINGLGVLGWGVGGIEAEAAMLGQPMSMLIPQVIGFKLAGELPEGATATDLVLTVTEMLRKKGVVGKFVEFFGPGVAGAAAGRPRDDRQHEPRVRLDLRDLPDRRARRCATSSSPAGPKELIDLVEAYAKEQGLWHDERRRGADLLRHDRARPGRGRAVAGRARSARRTASR